MREGALHVEWIDRDAEDIDALGLKFGVHDCDRLSLAVGSCVRDNNSALDEEGEMD